MWSVGVDHRQHLDVGERRLTSALVVERADPHQPVRALLDRERAVGVRRVHRERRALDARLFGVGRVEHLDAVVVLLRPADVHPHQHLGPVGGVDAARARADGDDGLALVVLARQQRAHLHGLDVLAQLRQFGVGLRERLGAAGALLLRRHLVEHRQVVEPLPQLLDAAQFALRVGQLAGDLLGAGLVVPELRIGRFLLELVDAVAQTVDIEHPLHRGQRGVECCDVCLAVGIHGRSAYRPTRRNPPLLPPDRRIRG